MGFTGAIWTCFEKFASFSGRASRAEFWWFAAFLAVGTAFCYLADGLIFPAHGWSPIGSAFSLLTVVPGAAVTARRLHDTNRSGWLQMGGILPVIGWIFLIQWLYRPGEAGANRYGPDPLPRDEEEEEEEPEGDRGEAFALLEQRVMARFAQSRHWQPEQQDALADSQLAGSNERR